MFATQKKIRAAQGLLLAVAVPLVMYGYSAGPVINRTGAKVDGGLDCTGCHRTYAPANSGPGRVSISAVSYTPGVKQTITVTVEDPTAQRWGFQLTARYRSDETIQAGTFTPTSLTRVRCDPDGRDAPCNGAKEFAEHDQAATQLGTHDRGTFLVEWTPPVQDFGEVIFYFAGNAANGDGTNSGDHIYTSSKVVRTACNVSGTPGISFVGDAASLRTTLAPGGMFSIFGAGFVNTGNQYNAYSSDLVEGKLPTDFACVQVEIGGQPAPIQTVTGGRINAQMPALTGTGPVAVRVRVKSGDQTSASDPIEVQVAAIAPALFTSDGTHLAALDASNKNAPITSDAAAQPGDTVSLFGTGFGPSDPAVEAGVFPTGKSALSGPVTVSVGGVTLTGDAILYAGLAQGQPGVCQIDVQLPASLPDGDLPVIVQIAGLATQAGTVLPVKR